MKHSRSVWLSPYSNARLVAPLHVRREAEEGVVRAKAFFQGANAARAAAAAARTAAELREERAVAEALRMGVEVAKGGRLSCVH